MPPVPDPYRVLGVARGASQAEIKAAHRRLAKSHHPDAGGDAVRFLAIQDAYQLLADPVQRRRWDATHAPGPVPADVRERAARAGSATRRHGGAAGAAAPTPDAAAPPGGGGRGGRRSPDAGSASWTWSAEGVPWWDEPNRGGRGRGGRRGATAGTAASGSGRAAEDAGARETREPRTPGDEAPGSADGPEGREPPGGPVEGDGASGAEHETRRGAAGAGRPRRGGARSQGGGRRRRSAAATEADDGRGEDPAPSAGDVYARSSGAAWSAASRAYFRRVAAEIPRGARMGHSSRTGRVGWEPSAEEIAQAVAAHEDRRSGRRSAPPGRPVDPSGRRPTVPPDGSASAGRDDHGPLAGVRVLLRRLRQLIGG